MYVLAGRCGGYPEACANGGVDSNASGKRDAYYFRVWEWQVRQLVNRNIGNARSAPEEAIHRLGRENSRYQFRSYRGAIYSDKKVHMIFAKYASMPLLHRARNGGAN